MISLSQQSCAKVTRSFRHYHSGTQSHLSTSAGYFPLLLRALMGPLTARISGFTFKKQIMRSHNAIHPLCINHRQAVPLRLPSQQRHGDNHTSAGQPPPCLSGTIRWYRQNRAAVCDPVSQMAGEPECSTAHATRQDFCKRRLFVVPGQRGRMRNPFLPGRTPRPL